ncbi:MAG: helix-turn-helix transcriptional regulator [Lacunisphaera sp.]
MSSKSTVANQLKRLGDNLRRERMSQSMTQEKLSELADLNIRTLQRIEAGQTNILITTAIRLRDALKCNWDRLA